MSEIKINKPKAILNLGHMCRETGLSIGLMEQMLGTKDGVLTTRKCRGQDLGVEEAYIIHAKLTEYYNSQLEYLLEAADNGVEQIRKERLKDAKNTQKKTNSKKA